MSADKTSVSFAALSSGVPADETTDVLSAETRDILAEVEADQSLADRAAQNLAVVALAAPGEVTTSIGGSRRL